MRLGFHYTLCRLIVVALRDVPTCNMRIRPGRCLLSFLAAKYSRPISPGHRSLFVAKVRKQETLRHDRAPSAHRTGSSTPKVLALRQRSSGIRVSKFSWSQRDAQVHVTRRLCLSYPSVGAAARLKQTCQRIGDWTGDHSLSSLRREAICLRPGMSQSPAGCHVFVKRCCSQSNLCNAPCRCTGLCGFIERDADGDQHAFWRRCRCLKVHGGKVASEASKTQSLRQRSTTDHPCAQQRRGRMQMVASAT